MQVGAVPCSVMGDQPKQEQHPSTQTTAKGLEIPVPTRGEFLRNMEKVAPPPAEPPDRKPSGRRGTDE
jgi:hypothetical protein